MKAARNLEHFGEASRLIPWGTQTRAKSPGLLREIYGDAFPLYFTRAQGPHLWDLDGARYLDYRAALGPIILGYCHPEVDRAVKEQIDRGVIYSMPGDRELELARLVSDSVPGAENVRFLKTGAAAVDAAVRIARAYTGRELVLSQGYHGWHETFMAADPNSCRGVPSRLAGLLRRFGWGDLNAVRAQMREVGDQVACIILNVFEGRDPPPPGYLQGLLDLAEQYGALLVFDEVKTGFRLALGGAQERYGVTPHLTVLAKAMANGYPIAAVAGRREIMQVLDEPASPRVVVTNTLDGDLVGVAAAIATIKVLRRPSTYPRLYERGRILMQGLRQILTAHGLDAEVKGEPTHFKVALAGTDPRSGEPLNRRFIRELIRRGVFLTDEWLLTLAHTKAVVKRTLDIADRAAGALR